MDSGVRKPETPESLNESKVVTVFELYISICFNLIGRSVDAFAKALWLASNLQRLLTSPILLAFISSWKMSFSGFVKLASASPATNLDQPRR